jgi:hypothetical protein
MKKNKFFLFLIFILFVFNIFGIVYAFSFDDPASQPILSLTNFFNFGNTWKEIALGIIISVIIFVALFDILEFTPLFKNSIIKIISCLLIVFLIAYLNLTNTIILWLVSFAAGFGAIGGFVLIIAGIIFFILLSLGSLPLAKLAAKMKRY